MPGEIELLTILIMLAVPVLLVAAVVLLRGRRDRIAELESQIEELASTEQRS